jgi:GTPase-associated protein 1, N-terminal domain type 2
MKKYYKSYDDINELNELKVDSTMKMGSEQLWYTWSSRGPENPGFQIRAASPGLLEDDHAVNIHSDRIQELLKHVTYMLPQNIKDSSTTPLENAPISLAFVQANQEFILVHKNYVEPEGESRPGAFFTHLITDLPTISTAGGMQPFTAREAITFWNASYWKAADELEPQQQQLPYVLFPTLQEPDTLSNDCDRMRNGPLSQEDLIQLPREQIEFILRAFLMRQPGQRIYIAAEPEVVARLIWGLAHSLPRTLDIFKEMTFDTYERIAGERIAPLYGYKGDAKYFPTITGTCWPTNQSSELPISYYQDQGVHGYALNCYTGRSTPLMPENVIARFVLFAADCLLDENEHRYRELAELLRQAEAEQCCDLDHFMRIYISHQETLSQNDVQELIQIVKQRLDNIVDEETMLLADLSRLRRNNVQRSIIQWIAKNRSWWEYTCRHDLAAFFTCLEKYANYPLPSNIQQVLDTLQDVVMALGEMVALQVNEAINTNHTDLMYFWMDMLDLTAPLRQCAPVWLSLIKGFSAEDLNGPIFQRWWQIKGESIFATIHQTLRLQQTSNPITALTPLGKNIADKIHQAIQNNDRWAIDDWQDKLTKVAPPKEEPTAWLYLFQLLVTTSYNSLYWDWWNAYGKQKANELNILGKQNEIIEERLYQIGDLLVKNIVTMIQQEDTQKGMQSSPNWPVWSIWNEMLSTLVVLTATQIGACKVWLNLWGHLWPYIFTRTYEQWWQRQGSENSIIIRQCAEAYPDSEVAQNVADFIFESILPLTYSQINAMLDLTEDQNPEAPRNNLFLLLRVLVHTIPQPYQEAVWVDASGGLLEYLTQTIHITTVDEIYSWEIHRVLLEAWAQIETIQTHSSIYPWLTVSWGTIGRLIMNENLPTLWHSIAVENILITPVTMEIPQLKQLLASSQGWNIFEAVLQSYVEKADTAQIAVQFFQYLIEIADPHKSQLLGSLLLAGRQQPEIVQELLQLAQLTAEEVSAFLENDCLEIIQQADWPEAFTPLVEQYLTDFDARRLSKPITQTFLRHLQTRNQHVACALTDNLARYVDAWLYVGELVQEPLSGKQWTRQAYTRLHYLIELQSEPRLRLTDLIIPMLIPHISSEMDLTRLLDNLGTVLTAITHDSTEETSNTCILLKMAPHIHIHYQQQRQLSYVMPYIKIALEQAQELLHPHNETFLDRFFHELFGEGDLDAYNLISKQTELWHPMIREGWNDYIQRQQEVYTTTILKRFKSALKSGDVAVITQAYQNVLREVQYPGTHINQQERDIALLAGDVVSSHALQDYEALKQAHQEIQQSAYRDLIKYPAEIEHSLNNQPRIGGPKAKTTRPLRQPRESIVLSNRAIPLDTETIRVFEQAVTETNPRTSIGTVQAKSIMLDQLNKVNALKHIYIDYQLSTIDTKIKNAAWNSRDKIYYRKIKKDLQDWQRQTDQFLRQKSLDDLIDNVFINSGIEARIKQGQCSIEEFSLEPRIVEQFRQYQPDKYQATVEKYGFSETDIKQVLRIFRRRERFAERLLKEHHDLDSWLEERKKLHKDQIKIEFGW